MDKKEQTRKRVKRYRERQKSVTNVTQSPHSVTIKEALQDKDVTLLHRPNGLDYSPNEIWDGRLRYLLLSDGQVLDRNTVRADLTRLSSNRLMQLREWAQTPAFRPLNPDRAVLKELREVTNGKAKCN